MHYICDCVCTSVCVLLCAYDCTRSLSCLPEQAAEAGLSVTLDVSACYSECVHLHGVCSCVRTPVCLLALSLGPV